MNVHDVKKLQEAVEKIDVAAVPAETKKPKKGDAGEEDVDIGDEMPASNFPPVQIDKDIDKDNDRGSSNSSSSSSDSSSSSGIDLLTLNFKCEPTEKQKNLI